MAPFTEPIEHPMGKIRLTVRTARTARTGPTACIEVYNGKLLFSDEVKLDREEDRRRFAKRLADDVADVDEACVRGALLELKPKVEEALKEAEQETECGLSASYEQKGDGLYWNKVTTDGVVIPTHLSNFTARITTDIVEDDGAEERRFFEIEAALNGKQKRFTISVDEFNATNWPTDKLGAGAIVYPGFSAKDRLRTAIQTLSPDAEQRRVYVHTGWQKEDDRWVYLHATGGIGNNGNNANVCVDLDRHNLISYKLPDPPEGNELHQAIQASLSTQELGPRNITVPLFAGTYRAPLAEMTAAGQSIFIEGSTGCQKSSLTAIYQAHYGPDFTYNHLPGSWESTDNSLELQAFAAKDAVFVVDDFKPKGTKWDIEELHKKADRLLRGQANQQGRGRMTADATLRSSYHPRGLIISSGEDVPKGQSLNARMVILPLQKGDVDLDRLTEAQENARKGVLAQAMAGYLQWLASQVDNLWESLPRRQEELRTEARNQVAAAHDRTPENVASLALGWEMFLRFAEEKGALTAGEREGLWTEGWKTLLQSGSTQETEQESQDEALRFVELVSSAISSGQAHLAWKDDTHPPVASSWGWRGVERNDEDVYIPQGTRIGWVDKSCVYLNPSASYTVAQKLAEQEGERLTVTPKTLHKRLQQAGTLADHDIGRSTVRRDIGGRQKRVLFLKPGVLGEKSGPSGPTGPQEGTQ